MKASICFYLLVLLLNVCVGHRAISKEADQLGFGRISVEIDKVEKGTVKYSVNARTFSGEKVSIDPVEKEWLQNQEKIRELATTPVDGFVAYCRVLKSGDFDCAINNLVDTEDPAASKQLLQFYKNPDYVKQVIEGSKKIESVEPVLLVSKDDGLIQFYSLLEGSDNRVPNLIVMKQHGSIWKILPSSVTDGQDIMEMDIIEALARREKAGKGVISFVAESRE